MAPRKKSKKENVGPVEEINGPDLTTGTNNGANVAGDKSPPKLLVDSFYEKLRKLNESSGLSLLFNFRQTSLDLFKFYEEVTERGGYYQVTKDGKWDEVASSLISEGSPSLLPDQLQKIYGNLLSPFEQIHHYRTPAKVAATSGNHLLSGDCLSCLKRKRKYCNSSPPLNVCFGAQILPSPKMICNDDSNGSTGPQSIEAKRTLKIDEDIKEDSKSPPKPRSQNKRKRYCKASKKEKEKLNKEMKINNDDKDMAKPKPRNTTTREKPKPVVVSSSKMMWPITDHGDYHATLQPAPENIRIPDECDIEFAIQLMKNNPVNDTVFQINLEEYWSIDLPG